MTHRSLLRKYPSAFQKIESNGMEIREVIMGIVLRTCCQVSLQEEREICVSLPLFRV